MASKLANARARLASYRETANENLGLALGGAGAWVASGWVGSQLAAAEAGDPNAKTPDIEIMGRQIPRYELYAAVVAIGSAVGLKNKSQRQYRQAGLLTAAGMLGAARGDRARREWEPS